jgi:anti-anti-sigma factor
MRIIQHVDGSQVVLTIRGGVCLNESGTFLADAVQRACMVEGVQTIVLDMADVALVDASGLVGCLLKARRIVKDRGLRLVLRALQRKVLHVLEGSGVVPYFTCD